jgi:hypothetical protein
MDQIDKKELETIDIDAPLNEPETEPSEPETPDIPSPKKSHKALIFVIISIIVAVLLIAASVYYWIFVRQAPANIISSSGTAAKVNTPADSTDTTDYAKNIIDKIRVSESSLATTYPKSKVEDTDPNAPAYKYGSTTYYVSGNFGHSLTITNSTAIGVYDPAFNTAGEQAAISVLDKESLTKKQTNFSYRYSNDNAKVVCNLSHLSYPVYISCANTRDYKTPSETVAPFAKAYLASPEVSKDSEVVFGQPNITNKTGSYKKATVGIGGFESSGGFAGLFYTKGKDWVYWRGTQSEIACADYNTYDLQKSFEGEACYVDGQVNDSAVVVTLKP